jgi:FixJ family two-component response regulator
MPKVDGLQLREKLLEERPRIKMLLMSGQVDLAVEEVFLQKPFAAHTLIDRVRERLLF